MSRFNHTIHYCIVDNTATIYVTTEACELGIVECQELIREEYPDIIFNPIIIIQDNQ